MTAATAPPMKKPTAKTRRLRPRGSGGIYPIRKGVYRVDVEVARDSETGKRRRRSKVVYGSREDAEHQLAVMKVGTPPQPRLARTGRRTMRVLFDTYLDEVADSTRDLSPTTRVTSRSAANTMCKQRLSDGRLFGELSPSRVTWKEVEDLYRAMRNSGLGADWIRRSATVLSQAFETAKKLQLAGGNPCRDAKRPASVRKKPFSPHHAEVAELLASVSSSAPMDRVDEELVDAVEILRGTGMRRGELLALLVEDVDLQKNELHLDAAIVDGGVGVGIVRKKTKPSKWRDIPMGNRVADAVRRQLHRRAELFGETPGPQQYLFASDFEGSKPIRPDSLTKRLRNARGESPLTFLALRHFAATTMLDAGEEYRTVADVLGNSERTLQLHYDGRTNIRKREAVAALDD